LPRYNILIEEGLEKDGKEKLDADKRTLIGDPKANPSLERTTRKVH
jgi:hypothetical protein